MFIPREAMLLRIFIGEDDKFRHRPLYEYIVLKARERGLAGATVLRGPMSFGHSSRLHTTKILRLSEDLPIVIEIVDSEERSKAFFPSWRASWAAASSPSRRSKSCNMARTKSRSFEVQTCHDLRTQTLNGIKNAGLWPTALENGDLWQIAPENVDEAELAKQDAIGRAAFIGRPNIGKKTRLEIETWLKAHGLKWSPQVELSAEEYRVEARGP